MILIKNTKLDIDFDIHQGEDTKLISSLILWSITEVDNVILMIQ